MTSPEIECIVFFSSVSWRGWRGGRGEGGRGGGEMGGGGAEGKGLSSNRWKLCINKFHQMKITGDNIVE